MNTFNTTEKLSILTRVHRVQVQVLELVQVQVLELVIIIITKTIIIILNISSPEESLLVVL